MFREIARKKQALCREECIKLLKQEKRGVLSVIGDEGYPYGIPINHYYNEADGKIYFHSGNTDIRLMLSEHVIRLHTAYMTVEPARRDIGLIISEV